MRVFVTGASGLIGSHLCRALQERGDTIVATSRSARTSGDAVTWLAHTSPTAWSAALSRCDAVVNLAGASVARRWTRQRRDEMTRSRVQTTETLCRAIAEASVRPRVLVSGSAVHYYGQSRRDDTRFDETSPAGTGFLSQLTQHWEAATKACAKAGLRVVQLRTGVVLAADGGALPKMAASVRWGVGGRVGAGRQWISWIHIDDVVAIILRCIDDPELEGPVNAVAPQPATNAAFMRSIGKILHRPVWLPVPAVGLRLILGRMAEEMLVGGQRVVPAKVQAAGFTFRYADLDAALGDVLERGTAAAKVEESGQRGEGGS